MQEQAKEQIALWVFLGIVGFVLLLVGLVFGLCTFQLSNECQFIYNIFFPTQQATGPNPLQKTKKEACNVGYLRDEEDRCVLQGSSCTTAKGDDGTWQSNKQGMVICKQDATEADECPTVVQKDYLLLGQLCPCDNLKMCEEACQSNSVMYHASRDGYVCAWG